MKISFKEMVRKLPPGASDPTPVPTRRGGTVNAFVLYRDAEGRRVARYYDTDILTLDHDGSVTITFGGWHTLTTRERFNIAASKFGVPLRARAMPCREARKAFGVDNATDVLLYGPRTWKLVRRFCGTAVFRIGADELAQRRHDAMNAQLTQ